MARDIYQNGRKVGELLTHDEAHARQTGELVGDVWNLSPMAFLVTIFAWCAVEVRTDTFISHPIIWGGLTVLSLTCMIRGNWAILALFLPFMIAHFYPGYYWIGLALLWLLITGAAAANKEEQAKAAAIAASGGSSLASATQAAQPTAPRAAGGPTTHPRSCEFFEPLAYKIQLSGDAVAANIAFKFTNPFEKKGIARMECNLRVLYANNEVFAETRFNVSGPIGPSESKSLQLDTDEVHADSAAGKLMLANRTPHFVYSITKFVFTDGTEQLTTFPHILGAILNT